jgi:hypothetical protein
MAALIERRIEALEALAGPRNQSLRVVICKVGETSEQAMMRQGVQPDDAVVIIVKFG